MNLRTYPNAVVLELEEIALRGRGVYWLRIIELEPGNVETQLRQAAFAYRGGPDSRSTALDQWLEPVEAFSHPNEPVASLELLAALEEQGPEACAERVRRYIADGLSYGAHEAEVESARFAEGLGPREACELCKTKPASMTLYRVAGRGKRETRACGRCYAQALLEDA